jgi:hypothetical protein
MCNMEHQTFVFKDIQTSSLSIDFTLNFRKLFVKQFNIYRLLMILVMKQYENTIYQ